MKQPYVKKTIDTTTFNQHVNGKSKKTREIEFIIATSKNFELPLPKI